MTHVLGLTAVSSVTTKYTVLRPILSKFSGQKICKTTKGHPNLGSENFSTASFNSSNRNLGEVLR